MTADSDHHQPERSDLDLLSAHRTGDPEAFGELFARHRDRLWAIALRTTGNPEDAADALQDAIVSAFRRVDSFRGEAAVTTWLHRIVVNASLDRLRRNKVRRAEPLPQHHDVPTETVADNPAESAEVGDRRAVVLHALAQISPDQRAALVLVDMQGHPVEEAAAILGCPTGTVKSRCARGRARLAELLRGTIADPRASDLQGGPSMLPGELHGGLPGELHGGLHGGLPVPPPGQRPHHLPGEESP